MKHTITREELSSLLASANPPLLFEALPATYFNAQHLPGARNMPHDEVAALAPRLAPDRTAPVVVYCANAACQNSHIAAGDAALVAHPEDADKLVQGEADGDCMLY